MKITTVGIDLAKNVFQVHGVDERGKVVLRKQLRRDQMARVLRQSAAVPDRHGGVRQRAPLGAEAAELGHTRRLMAPQFVKPYVKTQQERRRRCRGDLRSGGAARTCASCRSRAWSSRRCWRCTGCARDS